MKKQLPWNDSALKEWSIVGISHYHINGEKRIFVAMIKDGLCIKEEGLDDEYLWNRLWHKATNLKIESLPKPKTNRKIK